MTLFMKTKKKSSGDYFTGKNIGAMEMIGPYKLSFYISSTCKKWIVSGASFLRNSETVLVKGDALW